MGIQDVSGYVKELQDVSEAVQGITVHFRGVLRDYRAFKRGFRGVLGDPQVSGGSRKFQAM